MQKIIVVDDYLPSRNNIVKHVGKLGGYEIISTLTDGFELIRFCQQQKVLPDIVLLDVLMPKFDGVSTMEYMNTYFPAVKIIAVSSFELEKVITDRLSCGAWAIYLRIKN